MQQFRKVNPCPLKERISRGISKAQLSTKDLENSEKQRKIRLPLADLRW